MKEPNQESCEKQENINTPEEAQEEKASEKVSESEEAKEAEKEAKQEPEPEEKPEVSQEETMETKMAQMKDQLLRTMAEFDNYRKRTTKEKDQIFNRGVSYVVEAILPVIDNFERALNAAKDKEDNFVKGVEMTYNQMMGALKNLGVEPIEALGKTFDPHFHDAMQHVEDDNYGESEIVAVFQRGYMLNDVVIRPSMVKVAN